MANRERIKHILNNAEKLCLKVMRPKHIQKYIPNAFEYRVFVNLFDNEIQGIGIDFDEDIAFLKAFSEAVERAYCLKLQLSGSAVAAHWSKEDAISNAKDELVERDAFLTKYLLGKVAKSILTNSLVDEINLLLNGKAKIELFDISSVEGIYSYLVVGKIKTGGIVIGLGTSKDKNKAIQKAIFESVSRVSYFLDYGVPSSNNEESNLLENIQSDEFLKSNFYLRSKENKETNPNLEKLKEDISYEIIGNLSEIVPELNIVIAQATSPSYQGMYKGELNESIINFERLETLSNSHVYYESLEQRLHPVG